MASCIWRVALGSALRDLQMRSSAATAPIFRPWDCSADVGVYPEKPAQSRGAHDLGWGCIPHISQRHRKAPLALLWTGIFPESIYSHELLFEQVSLLFHVTRLGLVLRAPSRLPTLLQNSCGQRDLLPSPQSLACVGSCPSTNQGPLCGCCFSLFSVIPLSLPSSSLCEWTGAGPLGS